MSETVTIWMEVTFNVTYLLVVWGLVAVMVYQRDRVAPADQKVARLVRWAFALLALGDTGHVGFRVLAFAQGDLETSVALFGQEVGLVGLGALSTAITVTLFYVLVLEIWRARFGKRYGWFGLLLLAAAGVRLILMVPAANQWSSTVPPQPWSLVRNIPLMIQGLGVAYLILRDARPAKDRAFTWIGISILVSYAMYIPVILFVQQAPLVGMLMIPKTMAYVAIGLICYFALYKPAAAARPEAESPAHLQTTTQSGAD